MDWWDWKDWSGWKKEWREGASRMYTAGWVEWLLQTCWAVGVSANGLGGYLFRVTQEPGAEVDAWFWVMVAWRVQRENGCYAHFAVILRFFIKVNKCLGITSKAAMLLLNDLTAEKRKVLNKLFLVLCVVYLLEWFPLFSLMAAFVTSGRGSQGVHQTRNRQWKRTSIGFSSPTSEHHVLIPRLIWNSQISLCADYEWKTSSTIVDMSSVSQSHLSTESA